MSLEAEVKYLRELVEHQKEFMEDMTAKLAETVVATISLTSAVVALNVRLTKLESRE